MSKKVRLGIIGLGQLINGSSNALVITLTELSAMAAPATTGLR